MLQEKARPGGKSATAARSMFSLTWLRHRWRRCALYGGALLVLFAIGCLWIAPLAARSYVRNKLQAMIRDQLNAELRIDRLRYKYPYGVDVDGASLITSGPDNQTVELMKLPFLHIELARLPFGSGPLVIKELTFKEPAFHLIQSESGLVGRQGLVRDVASATTLPTTNPVHRRRLSEMFELRLVSIEKGKIVYEDRTAAQSLPVTWTGIEAKLTTRPEQNPLYSFDFDAASGGAAAIAAKGKFHIDDLELRIEGFTVKALADPDLAESPVPGVFQKILRENRVRGAVDVQGAATLPLLRPREARFDVTAQVTDAQIAPARWDGRGIQKATITLRASDRPVLPSQPQVPGALYIHLTNGELHNQDNTALLNSAGAMIEAELRTWRLHELSARLLLGNERDQIPTEIRKLVEGLKLHGQIDVVGFAGGTWDPAATPDQRARAELRLTSPSLLATDRRLVFTNVVCDVVASTEVIRIAKDPQNNHHGLRADFYGGKIASDGKVIPRRPTSYDFRADFEAVDVRQLAAAFSSDGTSPSQASGKGTGSISFGGEALPEGRSVLDALIGYGEFEIVDGDFYQLPAIKQIGSAVSSGSDAARVGQAAAVFNIAKQKINFDKIAVSAPVVGLQGSGSIGFDETLDFRVIAAPLADWKRKLQGSRIPLIGNVAAELAGGVQKMLDTATGKLLYQFHITGQMGQPQVKTEPAPALKEGAVKLFTQMMKATQGDRLLDHLKNDK